MLGDQAVTTPTAEERQVSDAIRTAAMPMLRADPQVVHFPVLAKAALGTMADLPRVPRWRGPRAVDGPDRSGEPGLVEVTVGLTTDEGAVILAARVNGAGAALELDVETARAFFLAGLSACAAIDDPTMIDPDYNSTPDVVTLVGENPTDQQKETT